MIDSTERCKNCGCSKREHKGKNCKGKSGKDGKQWDPWQPGEYDRLVAEVEKQG